MFSTVEAPRFAVDAHLEERTCNPSFVMVEIGHGPSPVLGQQPHSFTGQQAYIGIEAGMRGEEAATSRATELKEKHDGINAFFLLHDLGEGEVYLDTTSSDEWYEGNFEAETVLPSGAADEVFAGNVFGDPLIAKNFGYTMNLLREVARLVAPAGTVVLRETITPWHNEFLQDYTASKAGLEITGRVEPADIEAWEKLEQLYGLHEGMHSLHPYSSAYYLFLAKATGSDRL